MKIFIGQVVSKKMEKTATVVIERVVIHPIYQKRFKRTKKYHVHDELGTDIGDTVKFSASKPYSKLKRWKIVEIIKGSKKQVKTKRKRSKK